MLLTGRLVALAALGVVAAFWSPIALGVWASVLVLAVTVDLALAAPVARIAAERRPAGPTRLGELTTATVAVRNGSRRTARLRLRDRWVPSAGADPAVSRWRLAAGETRELTTALRPTRRGRRPAVEVAVASLGPLGVAGRQRRRPLPGAALVLPAFPSRRLIPAKLARLRELEGSVTARRAGRGTEFDALRAYVPGDDATAVDWRATARSTGVVVRTFRPEQDRRVLVVLDTGRGSAARLGDEPRLDAAIDAALLLVAVVTRAGDRAGLVAVDRETQASLGVAGGRDRLRRASALTAGLEPRLVETDPTAVLGAVSTVAGRRALVVLFTALDEGPRAATTAVVRGLVRDHTLVVAAVTDPVADRAAAAVRADGAEPADAYLAAAATLQAEQRADFARRLQALGARVVEAPPDTFAGAVTDAYLDHRTGRR
ncbi:DUF58 domain-containing protein [Jatrophihabitans sp. YIM 134969]